VCMREREGERERERERLTLLGILEFSSVVPSTPIVAQRTLQGFV
jgi:hypothetical protein